MGILYIDGHADQFELFRVPEAFREVFGGEVSSTAMTFKNPEDSENAKYFCIKLDIEEIDDMNSMTKLKIARVFENLKNDDRIFKEINLLEATSDLDYIFSLHTHTMTPLKHQASMKKEFEDIREADQSPDSTNTVTTGESAPSTPDHDPLFYTSHDSHDDGDNNLPKFK